MTGTKVCRFCGDEFQRKPQARKSAWERTDYCCTEHQKLSEMGKTLDSMPMNGWWIHPRQIYWSRRAW